MLILSRKDLESLISINEVIEAVEGAFREVASNRALIPERLHLNLPDQNAVLLEMPAYLKSADPAASSLGSKVVSVFQNNPKRGLEPIQAIYLLLDAQTGEPLALMDARYITGIRTAATSAVATRYMATSDPKRLLIFGSGVQAMAHIDAMAALFDLESVVIISRSEENAKRLAKSATARFGIPCSVVTDQKVVSKSNLICTCTNSAIPVFDGSLLAAGTHLNAVGSFTTTTRELDTTTIIKSRVVIDTWEAAGSEAGEIHLPIAEGVLTSEHVCGTLAELVAGRIRGRENMDQITLFKSCGVAIQDLVTARLAYDRAVARSVGVAVEL